MSDVAVASEIARRLVQAESRGPGDTENAMRRISSRWGVPFTFLWSLRYRPPADILMRPIDFSSPLTRPNAKGKCGGWNMTSYSRKQKPGLIALLFARLALYWTRATRKPEPESDVSERMVNEGRW